MFRKTRRKIVFAIVLSLLLFLAGTLAVVYWSNRAALRRENEEMLRIYAQRYTLEDPEPWRNGERPPELPPDGADRLPADLPDGAAPPDSLPAEDDRGGLAPDQLDGRGPWRNEPALQLSTFYSVAYSPSGEVLSVRSGNSGLQSEQSLREIAAAILAEGRREGTRGSLTYLVADKENYTLVVMVDSTISENNQQTLMRQMLLFGSFALLLLCGASVWLAHRIVRPLEENDRRQKRFISDAGHELKTPLAVISANSELLRREIGESEWLSNIDYENGRMSDLVKQLLMLSRAEQGEIFREETDLSQLVNGELLPLESLAFEKGVRIESAIAPGLKLEGNAGQLRQLVSILLDNALSHGCGEEIRLALVREKHNAVLTVSNAAGEMSPEQLSHLFDRFYRMDEARSGAEPHYGLGLSIAKAIVNAHGGEIRGEYKEGKAIFTVSLPLK